MKIVCYLSASGLLALAAPGITQSTPQAGGHKTPVAVTKAPAVPIKALLRRGLIGINLSGVRYYSPNHPFLNRFKTAGEWSEGWQVPVGLAYDPDGYPLSMPKSGRLETLFAVDPPKGSATNRYILTYDGTASITILSGKIRDARRGIVIFEAENARLGLIVSSMDARDHLRNISVVRADQEGLLKAGKIFNPAYLERLRGFGIARFMDLSGTNSSSVVSWDDRSHVGDYSWAHVNGVPVEVMVALANELDAESWFNIPARANDDYVRHWAQLVSSSALKPVHVEYMNEAWNWAFPATTWAQEQANALWLKDMRDKDGRYPANAVWFNGGKPQVPGGMEIFYGYRAAQVARIVRTEFAKTAVKSLPVIGVQTAWQGLEDYAFQGIKRAAVGQPFAEYAVTAYYGNSLSGGEPADRQQVLSWASAGPAGVDLAFAEIMRGGALTRSDSLNRLSAILGYHAGVAAAHGLALVVYEANFHFTAVQYPPGPGRDAVIALQRAMRTDPRMGVADKQMIQNARAAGADSIALYNDFGDTSEWGGWGYAESVYAPAGRLDALKVLNH